MSSTLTNGMVLETMKKMGPSDGLTFLLEKLNQEPDIRTNRNNIGRRISRLKSKLKGLSTAPRAELLATKFDFKMSTPPAPVHVPAQATPAGDPSDVPAQGTPCDVLPEITWYVTYHASAREYS